MPLSQPLAAAATAAASFKAICRGRVALAAGNGGGRSIFRPLVLVFRLLKNGLLVLSFCKGEKDTVWNGDFIGSIEKEKRFAIEQTRLRIFGQARKKQADFDLWDFYFWLSANTAVPVVESHKSTDFDPLAAIKYPNS